MDANNEALFVEWENDTVFNNVTDDSFFNNYCNNLELEQRNQIPLENKNCYVQMDIDFDYAIAMSLQEEFNDEVKENASINSEKCEASKPLSLVDEQWELIDPHPDIHALFVEYDERFFYGKLKSVEVRWSPRMTLCAGICSYQGKGGLCSIGLSEPLLKLRPRRDLVETLLHEMIHAYLFVTENNRDRDGHGPEFLGHMYRINREAGTKITVYHSFHAEVNLYKQHWWKCDGPCSNRAPYFGLVKRVMNRAPGPNDNWWTAHQLSCGGKFIKIKEPSNFKEKKVPKRKLQSDPKSKPSDIRKFVKSNNQEDSNKGLGQLNSLDIGSHAVGIQKTSSLNKDSLAVINAMDVSKKKNFIPFQGTGHKLVISSRTSQVPSKDLFVHVKNSDLKGRTDFSSILSRNSGIKGTSISPGKILLNKVETSSVLGKTPNKRDLLSSYSSKTFKKRNTITSSPKKTRTIDELFSNSCRKVPTVKNWPSNLSGNLETVTPSRPVEIQRMSNANDALDLQSGLGFTSKTYSSKTNRSNKSAVENTLSSQNKSKKPQESNAADVNFSTGASTKLCCPVCSDIVIEEINVHLDKCLKNSTV